MKKFGEAIASFFSFDEKREPSKRNIYVEWDRQRARAKSPSELSEIDAIFSRAL